MRQKENFSIESENLSELLTLAKKLILLKGEKSESQRGNTYSLNKVLLTWTKPHVKAGRYLFRTKKEDEWYQNNFVRKNKINLPERIAKSGEYIFPYKYAHRGRYFDNGWGYALAVTTAIELAGGGISTHLKSFGSFNNWLENIGDLVHLQTVLSVLNWWNNYKNLNFWLKNESLIQEITRVTRIDPLEKITKEIKSSSETRRAITPSFMYMMDYLLNPMMGVPPYQNFQLLPNKRSDILSSLHWHRSLDASGGAQLDFNHDFNWLTYATIKTQRKIGSVSIMAGNLHLYMPEETNNVHDWLLRVTDGYRSGSKFAKELLKKEAYIKNARKVYLQLIK